MKSLERTLGLGAIVIISVSAMLGSGVFVLPGVAIGVGGGATFLAYAAAALAVLPAALSKAELSSAIPRSGGAYVFVRVAFGPLAGTITGFGLWFALLLKGSFALVGIGAYLLLLGDLPLIDTALWMLLGIVAVNLFGVNLVSRVQSILVFVSVGTLAWLIAVAAPEVDFSGFQPFFQGGAQGFLGTVAFVFVSYAGVTKIAAIAGEVRDPGKNIPRAMLLTLGLVTPLYALVAAVLCGVIPQRLLTNDIRPVYSLAARVMGPTSAALVAVVAVLTMASMANAGVLAASRFPFAMSRDLLIPGFLGKLGRRFGTPIYCIVITGLVMAVAITELEITRIIKLASAFQIIAFLLNNIALIVMRTANASWYRPDYRAPLYPWIQIFGIVFCLVLLAAMPGASFYALLAIGIPGAILFAVYGRHQRHPGPGLLSKIGQRFDLMPEVVRRARDTETALPEEAAVVVTLFGDDRCIETLTRIGIALSDGERLEVLHVTEVSGQIALDEMTHEDQSVAAARRRVLTIKEQSRLPIDFEPVVTHDLVATMHAAASKLGCHWLLLSYPEYSFYNQLGWLLSHLPSDLALFRDSGITEFRNIMVYVEPGPSDSLVATVARRLGDHFGSNVALVRFAELGASAATMAADASYLDQMRELYGAPVETHILRGDSCVETLVHATETYDLLVLGSVNRPSLLSSFIKDWPERVAHRAVCSVLKLRSPQWRPHAAIAPRKVFSVADHLDERCVATGVVANNKTDIFAACAERFCAAHPELLTKTLVEGLWAREKTQNTSVGHGVAMPHATISELSNTGLIVLVLNSPVDYNAPDGTPVEFVIATIGPPGDRQTHLNLISSFAGALMNSELLTRLRAAQDSKAVLAALEECLG